MIKASILVLTGRNCDAQSLKALCTVAAKRDLHLSILVTGRLPVLPIYATGMGDFAGSVDYELWQKELNDEKAVLQATAQRLKDMLAENRGPSHVQSTVSVLNADPASFTDALARHALTADLVLATDDLRDDHDLFSQTVRAALFHSPAGTLLNGLQGETPLYPKRVFIAWNSGIQASRAIRAAMPILKTAEEIIVALVDPVMSAHRDGENPGSDVAYWLSHLGFKVNVQQYPSGGMEIGECLLKRAQEVQADLIVMGAYDHSRMRQIIFGGTTRTMVEQTSLPVLLAH